MTWVNGVSGVTWVSAVEGVVPFSGDLRAGGDSDHVGGDGLVVRVDATVADDVYTGLCESAEGHYNARDEPFDVTSEMG